MSLSDLLREGAGGLWEANFSHPFVRGIGDGSLAEEKFRFYLAQDYVYLKNFVRFFSLAAAKADGLETMGKFSSFVETTLNYEMDLHRSICADFGISAGELEATVPSPVCLGYTSYLLRVAYEGNLADIAAVLLPCEWGYFDIASRLLGRGLPAQRHYARWIETYASTEFEELVAWCRSLLDRLVPYADDASSTRLQAIFNNALGWEYMFWEMSWRMQTWPAA
ncbi:MAG TPA: thiaminase II [Acidobacteriota bacterium]|nr:thiaminase II [Acidobacteriota bacterium]